ncbi:MAG: aminoacyl-tRNA hydrolase [Gammaproteobacteria bacterium]|nr:aminoacyl-tRNA hydrolase [Gammaproteobacteria bacterium]
MLDIDLIVGLGNPGSDYEKTRHNIGFWCVDALAHLHYVDFKSEKKFFGSVCKISVGGRTIWLLKPATFMNRSGQSVLALSCFYKIPLERILVVHDELDLPPGEVRLKKGGGHGGHNGLRDIAAAFSSKEFLRIRMGIGHPGRKEQVTNYVLGRPNTQDQQIFDEAIFYACDILPLLIKDGLQKAMNQLHKPKLK